MCRHFCLISYFCIYSFFESGTHIFILSLYFSYYWLRSVQGMLGCRTFYLTVWSENNDRLLAGLPCYLINDESTSTQRCVPNGVVSRISKSFLYGVAEVGGEGGVETGGGSDSSGVVERDRSDTGQETFIPEEDLGRCPHCNAHRTMTRYREFEDLSLLGALFLTLFRLKGYQKVGL